MKIKSAAALSAAAFTILLSGCAGTEPETVSETSETTAATTENPYLLVRGWDGSELLDSVFFCGENHPLPIALNKDTELILSDGNLIFPDGSYAEATVNTENDQPIVTALRFRRETAPADFSLYGTDFSLRPDDVPNIFGFANSVYGSEETTLVHSFFGGGITELTLVFKNDILSEVYIAS
ncbi:MAG: hypothetical protein K2J72_06145 [Oscillospiraceae bacterium]|nr:hypothetical protein [Oscillospiraceae bacterium]